jgi:3-phosphoshikimate 1-carboxyvinyltransferase
MSVVRFDPAGSLRGSVEPPPDKSISHRAALIGAMSEGETRITNYLDAADTNSTLDAVAAVGAGVERDADDGTVVVRGVGPFGTVVPAGDIDVGNAGTLMRLLPGWLAAQDGRAFTLDGDASIRRRPVDRIAAPLRAMGAQIDATDGRLPPFTITGTPLRPATYEMPMASAQVKSCVLLAGLLAGGGATTVIEPQRSRDHTERMLAAAGATVRRDGLGVSVEPVDSLAETEIRVPADISSAAFLIAAAVLVAGSDVTLRGVNVNWTRTGLLSILDRMGAVVEGDREADPGDVVPADDPVSDLRIVAGPLQATTVEADEVPLAIDELPLVALLGVFAEGETVVRGAQELRVKESDRIATVVDGLTALGAQIEATDDGFVVTGTGALRGGTIASHGDHRLAMLGAVAGLASSEGVTVDGMDAAAVSYPGFEADVATLIAR